MNVSSAPAQNLLLAAVVTLHLIFTQGALGQELRDEASAVPTPGSTGNADNIPFIGRRDASGNPVRLAKRSGHVSNYDEAKVAKYELPDPLKMNDGTQVSTAEHWLKRKAEVLSFYQSEIYGRVPDNAPQVKWSVSATDDQALGGLAILKKVQGVVGNGTGTVLNVSLYLPKQVQGPVPVLLNLSFFSGDRPQRPASDANRAGDVPFSPVAKVLEQGWAFAQIGYNEIQPDKPDQWQQGVIGQTLKQGQTQPASDEWGTISAWAWGASRVADYLESDTNIDSKRIAITGASRLGKTALWAAAQDERFASVFSAVPGEMGASLIRRDWGETLDDMAQNFAYQFAGNLQKWVGKWNTLPVDQHMLIALIAPRPVYVNGGLSDQWSDPKGEFLALVAAGPVYRLLGVKDLGTEQLPELDQPVVTGRLAFHYHSKGHQSVPEDWRLFLEFSERNYSTK